MTTTDTVGLRLIGQPVLVLASDAVVRRGLEQAWARCLADPVPASTAPVVLDLDALASEEGPLRPDVVDSLVTGVAVEAAAGRFLLLHACGLSDATGRVAALLGPSGAGKSTAAAELATRFGYVSDEVVAVRADGSIEPFPRPLGLDLDRDTGAKTRVTAEQLGLQAAAGDVRLGRLVVIDRSGPEGSAPVIESLHLVEAILAALPQTSYLLRLDQPLATLARAVASAGPVRVTYATAADLGEVVSRLLSAPPTPLGFEPLAPGHDEGGTMRWALLDARVRRRPVTDAIRVDDRIVVLVDATPVVIDGIGTTIWEAAAEAPTLAEVTARVEQAHGPHPQAGELVAAAVDALVGSGVLGHGRPRALAALMAPSAEVEAAQGEASAAICAPDGLV